jgi:hypothetical protein
MLTASRINSVEEVLTHADKFAEHLRYLINAEREDDTVSSRARVNGLRNVLNAHNSTIGRLKQLYK